MWEAALSAFENLFGCPCVWGIIPSRLLFLFAGVVFGLALGAIPGLGGLVGLAILLPFTYTMDAFEALAIMIGLLAVTTTSDTIPSVLFAVPGTTGSQATILDDIPWRAGAKQAELSARLTWRRCWAASSARLCSPFPCLCFDRWFLRSVLRSFS